MLFSQSAPKTSLVPKTTYRFLCGFAIMCAVLLAKKHNCFLAKEFTLLVNRGVFFNAFYFVLKLRFLRNALKKGLHKYQSTYCILTRQTIRL